jgi:hypothetical protein
MMRDFKVSSESLLYLKNRGIITTGISLARTRLNKIQERETATHHREGYVARRK